MDYFLNNIKSWYLRHNDKDKFIIKILLMSLLLILYYNFVWQPIDDFKSKNIQKLKRNKYYEDWLGNNYGGVGKIYNEVLNNDSSLLKKIDKVNKENNLKFDSFSNESEDQVTISFYNVEFNNLLAWVRDIEEKSNLRITQINIVKGTEEGFVNSSMIISD